MLGLKRKGIQQQVTTPGGTYVRGFPCRQESMSFCFRDMLGTTLCGVSVCLVTAFVSQHLFKGVCSVALWGQKELFFFFFFADRDNEDSVSFGDQGWAALLAAPL